jgi:hypothetical protein
VKIQAKKMRLILSESRGARNSGSGSGVGFEARGESKGQTSESLEKRSIF